MWGECPINHPHEFSDGDTIRLNTRRVFEFFKFWFMFSPLKRPGYSFSGSLLFASFVCYKVMR
jgi:hypothetical protein